MLSDLVSYKINYFYELNVYRTTFENLQSRKSNKIHERDNRMVKRMKVMSSQVFAAVMPRQEPCS